MRLFGSEARGAAEFVAQRGGVDVIVLAQMLDRAGDDALARELGAMRLL